MHIHARPIMSLILCLNVHLGTRPNMRPTSAPHDVTKRRAKQVARNTNDTRRIQRNVHHRSHQYDCAGVRCSAKQKTRKKCVTWLTTYATPRSCMVIPSQGFTPNGLCNAHVRKKMYEVITKCKNWFLVDWIEHSCFTLKTLIADRKINVKLNDLRYVLVLCGL